MVKYDNIANEFVSEEGTKWTGSRIDDHIILINRKNTNVLQKSCYTCGYPPYSSACDTCEGYSNWWSLE